MLPQSITAVIESLSSLPGIGYRSAERLTFSLLKNKTNIDQTISASIGKLKASICECSKCFNYCEINHETVSKQNLQICAICQDPTRNPKTLCIIESPIDLIALERTHEFKGLYHVLHGIISPMNKILPQDLRISELLKRIENNNDLEEIIIATAGNIEADATANFLHQEILKIFSGKVSRIARGIPSGGNLDYLDSGTIGRALLDRRNF